MFAAGIPAAATALSAAFDYFGQSSANKSNRKIARETNKFNAQQAQLNREFQDRESSTAWQRGVADMRKAGINPMLSVSQGGASAPAGSTASGTTGAPMQSTTKGLAHSALAAVQLKSQLDNLNADTKVKQATAANLAAQTPRVQAHSAFEASKYGVKNDLVDLVKRAVGYTKHVSSAKSAASDYHPRTSTYKSRYEAKHPILNSFSTSHF